MEQLSVEINRNNLFYKTLTSLGYELENRLVDTDFEKYYKKKLPKNKIICFYKMATPFNLATPFSSLTLSKINNILDGDINSKTLAILIDFNTLFKKYESLELKFIEGEVIDIMQEKILKAERKLLKENYKKIINFL